MGSAPGCFARWARGARLAVRLGPANVARVLAYRIGLRLRLHPVVYLRSDPPRGPFFRPPYEPSGLWPEDVPAGEWRLFGWLKHRLSGEPPMWCSNVVTGRSVSDPYRPWWRIPDFCPSVGDIKAVWEASRFDWVVLLAARAASGQREALDTLNEWLSNWGSENRPYCGPNWKCGQEASIRVIHLAFAARILGQVRDPEAGLSELVRSHLRRIRSTVSYAIAQDNNHGTSEGAALFIGGSWLAHVAEDGTARRWSAAGRRLLEERVGRLIAPDGSFSQYSVNYHRLVLMTLGAAEQWRRDLGLVEFSRAYGDRVRASTRWLRAVVDPVSGDAPNFGANDGARLLPVSCERFRDYRPCVEWTAGLFEDRRAFPGRERCDVLHRVFGNPVAGEAMEPTSSQLFEDGGFAALRNESLFCFMSYPRYRFRPRQADALHIDLWHMGTNLLRDAGSYSYNTEARWQEYFPSTSAHNTVEFDGRDQMPRVGRFLRDRWLHTSELEPLRHADGETTFAAAYVDWTGSRHRREVRLGAHRVIVDDEVTGFSARAVLRWRLQPAAWQLEENRVESDSCSLEVSAGARIVRFELVEGWEARHYLEKTPLPVLEIEVAEPTSLRTVIEVKPAGASRPGG